jgi:hypothetical protein
MCATVLALEAATAGPVGKRFPSVTGSSLAGAEVRLPDDLNVPATVLLVAYRRGTQDDVDRWTGLPDREAPEVVWYEVPTISSPVWRPLAGWIDAGMRGGVPEARWARVVTLYRDAPAVARLLGDPGGLTAQVVVLDRAGNVRWHHGSGFSEAAGAQLVETVRGLVGGGDGGTDGA